jgi:hypothetical protein
MSDKAAQLDGHEFIKGLAKENGVPIPDVLALNRNNDPFFSGSPAHRAWAEWFARLWREQNFPEGTHLRRAHYRLVSLEKPVALPAGGAYENTLYCWDKFQEASTHARHLGLVDARHFDDRRNPSPNLYAGYGDGLPEPFLELADVLPWSLPGIPTNLAWHLDFPIPTPQLFGYEPVLGDQPYHLELWIEKSTMNDELIPVCRQLSMNLVTSVGFQSITSAVKLLGRVNVICNLLGEGRMVRVFYISDFDPAGDSMPVAVSRQIEFYMKRYAPAADIKLNPLALTKSQVIKYRLPRIPIKEEDNRKAKFEGRYGTGAVELDALEALHPGELARIVRKAAEPYRDESLEARISEAGSEAEDAAAEAWEEVTEPHRQEVEEIEQEARQVYDRYRTQLEQLDDQLGAELEPLRERLEAVRHAIQAEVDQFDFDLPARPEAEIDPPDERDWLFDSGREYMEQLAAYKARKQADA